MSYFYSNSLHLKVDEEDGTSRALCQDIYPYPAAMIPTRTEDGIGHYSSNGYTTTNLSYTLVPQTYMWASDPTFVLQGQDSALSHSRHENESQYHPKHDNMDPDSRSRKRRLPTVAQRRAANVRERRRMFNLNEAFDSLRRRVPTFAYEKRLSRIETLRLAISYIAFMTDIVNGRNPEEVKFRVYRNHTGHDLTRRHANVSLVSDETGQDSNGYSTIDDSNSQNDQENYSEYESYGDD